MNCFSYYTDEKYKCSHCNKKFTRDDTDVLNSSFWKCPICGDFIQIAAPSLGSGYTLIRKPVSELKRYDSIFFIGYSEPFDVLEVRPVSGKILVALKNYGTKKYDPSDIVSVIIGGYYENGWE